MSEYKLILMFIVIIVFLYLYFKKEKINNSFKNKNLSLKADFENCESFGYKTAWLVCENQYYETAINILNLKDLYSLQWKKALAIREENNKNTLCIIPNVNEYMFVVGLALEAYSKTKQEDSENFLDFIKLLLNKIPNFYYFSSYRVDDLYCWVHVKNSKILRAYRTYQDEIIVDIENRTDEEKQSENDCFDPNSEFIDEESVINIAAIWSINPLNIGQYLNDQSIGILGKIKL